VRVAVLAGRACAFIGGVVAVVLWLLCATPALTGAEIVPVGPGSLGTSLSDGDGLQVVAQTPLDSRLLDVTVTTAAIDGPIDIRILLPAGYANDPTRRYPVLYLLPGTSGRAQDWTTLGGAEQTTNGLPLIVVMPDIGVNGNGGGWCTDSYNGGAGGPPEWETFHVDELVPWVDANLRTVADRDGRAIVGLSQGGFCALSYAARHPDLFAIAGSYSGADDIAYDPQAQAIAEPVIEFTAAVLDGVAPFALFGNPRTNEINWAAHDPTTLAANLRNTDLFMYTGNGQPGPLDAPATTPQQAAVTAEASAIEADVHELTTLFYRRLASLGIAATLEDYGPGTHSWPYWKRDLQQSIASIMADFGHPPATPTAVTYTSADSAYAVYGWNVRMHRAGQAFSTLARANARGFALAGTGSATVTTPALFVPRARYAVGVDPERGGRTSTIATAQSSGRLTVSVPLGPPNPSTEASPRTGPPAFTTRVTMTRAAHHAHRVHARD
jgi:S-formylglutathione hydrolase FrmB